MTNLTRIFIGAGVVLTGGYLLKLGMSSANIQTQTKANIHKFDLSGITIRVDAKIKNPTANTLKIKYPFITLSYKGEVIGSSQSINQDITIPKYGEANIQAIMISTPLTGLYSLSMDLLKSIKEGTGIKISIKTITTIFTPLSSFPYEFNEEQIIRK